MEVRVSDVKKWAGREESVQVVESWPDEAQARVDYPLANPARVDVRVRNTGGGALIVEVSGTVQAWAVCSRCAESFTIALPFSATEEFRDEAGRNDQSLDYSRFSGDVINLDEVVSDAVGLSFPIAVLCRPDCKGLCPQCGANWNQIECGCRAAVDDRWAQLAQLWVRDTSEPKEELERDNNGRTKT
ncbi:MAG: DUF177 domain-containing protein [Sulfobacillus acidophilus]|uniref:DUF177 domain-containing protein n=1 Tax=Sulfobacillus acidophilus TaxID=53633 RepID=A0A2T2WEQ0_9FIRM|nr:MAG: DUF177 domain-containing protein [Sulfobacillus acidophilus]